MADLSPARKEFTISIIGGGLAGLLLAIGLSKRGILVHIYEAASAFTETSAGIGFGPNAVRAMAMLDMRIYDAFRELKTENGWASKKSTWFDFRVGWGAVPELVAALDMGDGKEGVGNVLRARFMEELVKLLPDGSVSFGKTLSGIDETHDRVRLYFCDDTTVDADAVVGCDGIRSVTRKLLLGEDHVACKAVFAGMYLYRGLLNMETAIDAVGEELAVNSQVYMGKDGDLVTYPIENGSVLNVVAFRKHKENTWNHDTWVVDSSQEDLISDFRGWGPCVEKIVKVRYR
jgi:salicylate hydroxylase